LRKWVLIDAKGQILGRCASRIATILIGKHKVGYSQHMDSGDYVVVVNSEKIKVTGKKEKQKIYRSHSGYPGGLKEVSFARMVEKDPRKILKIAVSGMLPGNRLKDKRMNRLKLFVGDKHPYASKTITL